MYEWRRTWRRLFGLRQVLCRWPWIYLRWCGSWPKMVNLFTDDISILRSIELSCSTSEGASECVDQKLVGPNVLIPIPIVQWDSAGKSTPPSCLENNTTWDLVSDIEKIREYLQIDKWVVFGLAQPDPICVTSFPLTDMKSFLEDHGARPYLWLMLRSILST